MRFSTKIGGFKFGLHQPEQTITFGLMCPDGIDLKAIDAILVDFFGVALEQQPGAPVPGKADYNANALGWRSLLIARKFLQLAKAPVIEAGKLLTVLQARQNRNAWKINAAVPVLDRFPQELTKLAYGESLKLVRWLVDTRFSEESILQRREEIFLRTVEPMQAMVAGGISTVPLLDAAHRLGIPFRHRGSAVYQLGWGSRLHLFHRSAIDRDSAIGARLSQDKFATAGVLKDAGFPVPEHMLAYSDDVAVRAAEQLGWPVVVKPANLDRSEGVTIGIRDREKLLEAFAAARNLSQKVLVEKEVPGTCHRLLVAGGVVRYAISRRPPSLTGDGVRTIAELLSEREQASLRHPPWDRVKPVLLDAMTLDALTANGWSPADTPPAGSKVPLRRIESSEWRGDIDDVSNDVHPENCRLAERAARLFGLSIAGIDIITTDIRRPWHENGAVINEINYAPYFGGNPTARAAMPIFLGSVMPGQGRIPVEVFVGQHEALNKAQARQERYRSEGMRCYVTTHEQTWDADGRPAHIAADGVFHRALALLMDQSVDALLLVVQTAELLDTGLPVDRIDQVIDSDEPLAAREHLPTASARQAKSGLLALLHTYRAKPG